MNIYFDTEFTGLKKNATLVSIGLISESMRGFYAELTDYDKTYDDPWFKENVLNHLVSENPEMEKYFLDQIDFERHIGTKEEIREKLTDFLLKFDEVQLVSDVCHYDMVLFIDLFGTAFDLPRNVNPSCHDINQDIAKLFNVSEKDAFDMNRERIVDAMSNDKEQKNPFKHNAFYDALCIQKFYELYRRCEYEPAYIRSIREKYYIMECK